LKQLNFLICILAIATTACSASGNGAVNAIEAYIHALGNRDTALISNFSCANWEKAALVEVDSLTAVETSVKDLSCQQIGQDGDDILVSCTGVIALDYNGEAQEIDLSARTYIARQEGGEWRMCGYR